MQLPDLVLVAVRLCFYFASGLQAGIPSGAAEVS